MDTNKQETKKKFKIKFASSIHMNHKQQTT